MDPVLTGSDGFEKSTTWRPSFPLAIYAKDPRTAIASEPAATLTLPILTRAAGFETSYTSRKPLVLSCRTAIFGDRPATASEIATSTFVKAAVRGCRGTFSSRRAATAGRRGFDKSNTYSPAGSSMTYASGGDTEMLCTYPSVEYEASRKGVASSETSMI